MKNRKILLVLVPVVLVFAIAANSQGRGAAIPCPVPMNVSLTAPPPTAATPFNPDFPPPPPPPSGIEPKFGGTTHDRHFRHTFRWAPPAECCQYLSGKLTFRYKALRKGGSATSSDAGNDRWVIYKNGNVLATGSVYENFPFPAGTTGTKIILLTPAMLAGDHRLSFLVQDDTSIISATLTVVACCVNP